MGIPGGLRGLSGGLRDLPQTKPKQLARRAPIWACLDDDPKLLKLWDSSAELRAPKATLVHPEACRNANGSMKFA